jgi:phosphoglycolate phosphatase
MAGRVSTLGAVIFDFDGTLATLNIDFFHMRHMVMDHLAAYHVPTSSLKDLYVLEMIAEGKRMIDSRHPEIGLRYLREAGQLVQEIEMKAAKEGALIEGTREMLHELRRRKIKAGVITRNCRAALEQLFPDIETAVDIVLTRDHIARVKPDPEHLLQALRSLQARPERAAMIGDHPMDVRLGLDVGAMAIGVLTGASDRQKLEAAGAEMILPKAADIVHHLS